MGNMTSKLKTKQSAKTTWGTQVGKFTSLKKLNLDFFLPEFSATKIVIWKCHIDKSTNGRYDMIIVRDILSELVPDLKFSDNIISVREGTHEGCSTPMVDVSNYDFNIITDKAVKLEEYFINLYVNECLEYESVISATRRMYRIIDAKYKKIQS